MTSKEAKHAKIPAWACERCETYEGVDAREMKLFGGINTRLCIKCHNDWGRIEDLPEWDRIGQIDVEASALLAMSEQPGVDHRGKLEELRVEKEKLRKFFRDYGRKFMLELKEAEEPKA